VVDEDVVVRVNVDDVEADDRDDVANGLQHEYWMYGWS
jgi:hypothetical protein